MVKVADREGNEFASTLELDSIFLRVSLAAANEA